MLNQDFISVKERMNFGKQKCPILTMTLTIFIGCIIYTGLIELTNLRGLYV